MIVATLGKALGVNGGYAVADATVIDYLRETAPFYVYSNPITPGRPPRPSLPWRSWTAAGAGTPCTAAAPHPEGFEEGLGPGAGDPPAITRWCPS